MAGFTGWRFMVNFLLPPPLILMVLLVVPFPITVRKRILKLTSDMLSFPVFGGMKLVHFALILSGIPLIDSTVRTMQSAVAIQDKPEGNHPLGYNQMLGKKWREERNFWLTAMAFTLWCMLTVIHATVGTLVKLEEQNEELRRQNDDLTGVKHVEAPASTRVADAVTGIASRLGLNKTAKHAAAEAEAPDVGPGASDRNVQQLVEDEGIEMRANGSPSRNLRARARRAE